MLTHNGRWPSSILLPLFLALGAQGCSGSDPETPAIDAHALSVCVDEDGDGRGDGCDAGSDCNDTDPSIYDTCDCDPAVPETGCPCPEQGVHVICGPVELPIGHQTACGYGTMACNQGTWAACIINGTLTS